MPDLNTEDVVKLLRSRKTGSVKELADQIEMSDTYLCDVLSGKRKPGPVILQFLGLERVVTITYRRRKEQTDVAA